MRDYCDWCFSKLTEKDKRAPASELHAQLAARPTIRGEIVLMLTPTQQKGEAHTNSIAEAIAALMKSENLTEKEALKRVARDRGIGKSEAYRELQREQNRLR